MPHRDADSSVAPALQAKEAELKRAQIGVRIGTVKMRQGPCSFDERMHIRTR